MIAEEDMKIIWSHVLYMKDVTNVDVRFGSEIVNITWKNGKKKTYSIHNLGKTLEDIKMVTRKNKLERLLN